MRFLNTIPSPQMGRFNRLIGQTQAVYHDAARRLGLSDSALEILYALHAEGGACPLREICRNSCIPKQTIGSALRKLEEQGAVTCTAQGRRKLVSLTPEGRALAERTVGQLIAAENAVLDGWLEADTERYLALTEAFLIAMREKIRDFDIPPGAGPGISTGGQP